MKKISRSKAILSFLYSVIAAFVIGGIVSAKFGTPVLSASAGLFTGGVVFGVINHFVPMNAGGGTILTMAIQQEIWVDYIIGNLFKDNSFLTKCYDESDNVLAGSVVHIPQAGAKPTVVKNRSSFPATVVQRTDTDITYTLDVYSTDPTLITNAESKEISYDKIDSVLGEHVTSLEDTYADDMLYKWAPTVAGQITPTTGALVATSLAPSATGTRKKFLKEDLKKAQTIMNKQKISKQDRYALFPTDLLQELMEDADLMKRDGVNGNELDIKNGVIMKLYGFNIMERSDTTIYSVANAPKAPGAAAAVTDNQAVICWQKNCVAKAKGSATFFENTGDATYYGDVYSAEVKLGGRKRRTGGEGVVAIVQVA
jgi:hypothetical protein